jgi:hypothetical protein
VTPAAARRQEEHLLDDLPGFVANQLLKPRLRRFSTPDDLRHHLFVGVRRFDDPVVVSP